MHCFQATCLSRSLCHTSLCSSQTSTAAKSDCCRTWSACKQAEASSGASMIVTDRISSPAPSRYARYERFSVTRIPPSQFPKRKDQSPGARERQESRDDSWYGFEQISKCAGAPRPGRRLCAPAVAPMRVPSARIAADRRTGGLRRRWRCLLMAHIVAVPPAPVTAAYRPTAEFHGSRSLRARHRSRIPPAHASVRLRR